MNDLSIKKDVEAELQWEPSVNAAEIRVAVKEGIVTLTGRVSTYMEKMAARAATRAAGVKAAAKRTPRSVSSAICGGVKGVTNNIMVKPAVSTAVVKTQVEAALKHSAELDARRIIVQTQGIQ